MIHTEYKRNNMQAWNEVASRYHDRWAAPGAGPFGCTRALLEMMDVREGQAVLDVACGTGAVSRHLIRQVGPGGQVVGVDTSSVALDIARRESTPTNLTYVNADAESMWFGRRFDAASCQFGIFFFVDAPAVLRNIRRLVIPGGRLGMVVHGSRKMVPYHGCIIEEAMLHVPDYLGTGPSLDRYSRAEDLQDLVEGAQYSDVRIRTFTFEYSPGDFDSYWNGYTSYIPVAQRRRLLEYEDVVREGVRHRTRPYTDTEGTILFPWEVLILTAST